MAEPTSSNNLVRYNFPNHEITERDLLGFAGALVSANQANVDASLEHINFTLRELSTVINGCATSFLRQEEVNRHKINTAGDKLARSMDDLNDQVAESVNSLQTLALEITMETARARRNMTIEDKTKNDAAVQECYLHINRIMKTAEVQSKVILDLHDKKIGNFYKERDKEIQKLRQQMDVFKGAQDSQTSKILNLNELKLKYESVKLEQLAEVAKYYQQVSQVSLDKAREQNIHSEKMKELENMANEVAKKIELQQQELKNNKEIETLRINVGKDVDTLRINSDKEVDILRIYTDERCRIWEAIATILTPKVTIGAEIVNKSNDF